MPLESIGAQVGMIQKKRLKNISRHAPQNVENIGFERRNFRRSKKWRISDSNAETFRRSGNAIENEYNPIPATVI